MGGKGQGKKGISSLWDSAGGLGGQGLIWHLKLNKGGLNANTKNFKQYT
jgi:hypothetical protein